MSSWGALFWAGIFTVLIHCLAIAVWLNIKVNSPSFGKRDHVTRSEAEPRFKKGAK